jgi:hypothetical protein
MDELIHPVYVDGPLKGSDFPVQPDCRTVDAVVPLPVSVAALWHETPAWDTTMPVVTYHIRRFALRGDDGDTFMIWVACLAEPTSAELAEAILNDAAKAAKVAV